MAVDPKSVVLVAGATVVIALLLGMVLAHRRQRDVTFRWLVAGNVTLLLAVAALFARPVIGFEVGALLVITGAYVSICCAFFAVLSTEKSALPLKPLIILGVGALLVQSMIMYLFQSVNALMASSSLVNGTMAIWMATTIWTMLRPYGWRIAMLVILPFSSVAFGYWLRLVALIIAPDTDLPLVATVLIVTLLAWASIILELGIVALKERQTGQALEEALDRAGVAARSRSRFLLGVSHQLRTPLNGILGLSELMRAETAGPVAAGYRPVVEGIHKNGTALHDLVADLLDIAATDAGVSEIDRQRIELVTLCEEIAAAFRDRAAELTRTLNFNCDVDGFALIIGDRTRTRRMIASVLDNALKYAALKGHVEILLDATQGPDGAEQYVIAISDDGPGMADTDIPIALELFGRVGGVDDPFAGPGIGLTVAASIAAAHGGFLEVRSRIGNGTKVTISLPADDCEVADYPAADPQHQSVKAA